MDVYSVKPVDVDALVAAAAATGGRLVVVEDHDPEGVGSAVLEAVVRGCGPAVGCAPSGPRTAGLGSPAESWTQRESDSSA